jgi:hypothetical protein
VHLVVGRGRGDAVVGVDIGLRRVEVGLLEVWVGVLHGLGDHRTSHDALEGRCQDLVSLVIEHRREFLQRVPVRLQCLAEILVLREHLLALLAGQQMEAGRRGAHRVHLVECGAQRLLVEQPRLAGTLGRAARLHEIARNLVELRVRAGDQYRIVVVELRRHLELVGRGSEPVALSEGLRALDIGGLAVRFAEIADAAAQPIDEAWRILLLGRAAQLERESLAQPARLAGDRAGIILRIRRDQVAGLLAVIEVQAVAPAALVLLVVGHLGRLRLSRAARYARHGSGGIRRWQRTRLLAAILDRFGAGITAVLALHGNPQRTHHGVDVELDRAGHENLVAAAIHRIAGLHDDAPATAGMTGDRQAAGHAATHQEAVVQALLGDDVVSEGLQVVVGQELAGEEAGLHQHARIAAAARAPGTATAVTGAGTAAAAGAPASAATAARCGLAGRTRTRVITGARRGIAHGHEALALGATAASAAAAPGSVVLTTHIYVSPRATR